MRLHRKFDHWILCGTASLAFVAGWFASVHLTHLTQVRADSNRVFELNVYHAVPGKVPALEARFSDASRLIAKHHLEVIGYWVPNQNPGWDNTFVYLVAAGSREEMEKNWDAFHADPEFQKYVKSEHAEKLIERVDSTYMRPADYSALQ
jgi:hypothetical protein